MTRLESSAWALAGGSATVFVLAAVVKGQSWTIAFLVLGSAVAAWSLRAPLIAGMALGVIAWLFLTGFNVNSQGEIWFSSWADVIRLLVLAGLAPVMAAARRLPALGRDGAIEPTGTEPGWPVAPEEQIWATPHRLVGDGFLGTHVSSGVSDGDRYCRPAASPRVGPRPAVAGRGMNGRTVR